MAAPEPLSKWAMAEQDGAIFLHATAIALDGQGAMFLGASGAGKSNLAIAMLALGGHLIADDSIWVVPQGQTLILKPPPGAPAWIEARNVGLLNGGPICDAAPLCLVVDLDREEENRLPPHRFATMGAARVPLILGAGRARLDAVVALILRYGLAEV